MNVLPATATSPQLIHTLQQLFAWRARCDGKDVIPKKVDAKVDMWQLIAHAVHVTVEHHRHFVRCHSLIGGTQ